MPDDTDGVIGGQLPKQYFHQAITCFFSGNIIIPHPFYKLMRKLMPDEVVS